MTQLHFLTNAHVLLSNVLCWLGCKKLASTSILFLLNSCKPLQVRMSHHWRVTDAVLNKTDMDNNITHTHRETSQTLLHKTLSLSVSLSLSCPYVEKGNRCWEQRAALPVLLFSCGLVVSSMRCLCVCVCQ